jgi:hypothetical protein
MSEEEENELLGRIFRRLLKDNDGCWFAGLVPSGGALVLAPPGLPFGTPDLRTSLSEAEARLMRQVCPTSHRSDYE